MADDIKIDAIERVIPDVSKIIPASRRKKREKKERDEAGKHFEELSQTAEKGHQILSEKKSPYRFCVYQVEDDVFIDIVIVDADNKIKEIYKRNITRDEFQSWMQLIETESGMIVDKEV